jgi:hypothetical protein
LFKHRRCLNNNIWLKQKIKQKAVGANKADNNNKTMPPATKTTLQKEEKTNNRLRRLALKAPFKEPF